MRIVGTKNTLKLNANELLFMEGDEGKEMYIIKSGHVKVLKMEGNRMVTLAELGPGSIIGEMSLLDDAKRMATVRTLTVTELVIINKQLLNQTYQRLPHWLTSIIKILVQRMRETSQLKVRKDMIHSIPALTHVFIHQSANEQGIVTLPMQALVREASLLYGLDEGSLKKVVRVMAQEKLWGIETSSLGKEKISCNNIDPLKEMLSQLKNKESVGKYSEGFWNEAIKTHLAKN